MKKIRIGMIGAGFAASMFAQAFYLVENAELAGITDLNIERAREYAERYHIPRVYVNREEMLARDAIDAVYIGTTVYRFRWLCGDRSGIQSGKEPFRSCNNR